MYLEQYTELKICNKESIVIIKNTLFYMSFNEDAGKIKYF